MTTQNLLEKIRRLSEDNGVEFFGSAKLKSEDSYIFYEKWLSEKKHAGMRFLENNKNFRKDPSTLEPSLSNALVFGFNYYQGDKYAGQNSILKPRNAQYARFKDYHKVLKKIATNIMSQLFALSNLEFNYRVLVDSAPILERALAAKSGKGFIGKNTVFIDPDKGSFYLLFEVITDLDVDETSSKKVDPSIRSKDGGCGSCKRCKVHCPTGALDEDYVLDARKCLAYYSIEHRGAVPVEYWQYFKMYYFGCDICQLVCPYNRASNENRSIAVKVNSEIDLYEVALMDQAKYETLFGGTPMTRAKIDGLKRNALIYLVVTKDERLPEVINKLRGSYKSIDDTIALIPEYEAQLND